MGAHAHAGEDDLVDRVGDIFESIASSLQQMGKRSEDIVKPPFGPWRDFNTGPMPGAASYPFEELFPVRAPATIIIDNEFGEIRVNSWAQQVVQVNAEIAVGAETTELAHQIARSIDINVTPSENGLSIRTLLPDTREMGRTRIEVNYVLTIPRDANMVCRNHFGDTLLQRVGGNVAIDSAYGVVELRNIGGEVNVRARGEALQAHGLAKGGTFELLGCQAEFSNVSGTLRATNFMGSVVLRKLGTEADVDITNANGPVHMYVSEFDAPDLQCEVLSGTPVHIPSSRSGRRSGLRAQSECGIQAPGRFAHIFLLDPHCPGRAHGIRQPCPGRRQALRERRRTGRRLRAGHGARNRRHRGHRARRRNR